jgi:hypothetical protein
MGGFLLLDSRAGNGNYTGNLTDLNRKTTAPHAPDKLIRSLFVFAVIALVQLYFS